jgi:hypothetical protein
MCSQLKNPWIYTEKWTSHLEIPAANFAFSGQWYRLAINLLRNENGQNKFLPFE